MQSVQDKIKPKHIRRHLNEMRHELHIAKGSLGLGNSKDLVRWRKDNYEYYSTIVTVLENALKSNPLTH